MLLDPLAFLLLTPRWVSVVPIRMKHRVNFSPLNIFLNATMSSAAMSQREKNNPQIQGADTASKLPSKISDTKESDEKASSSPLQSESNADWWSPLFLPSLLPPVWPSPNLLTFWTPTLPKESSVVYLNIFE